jgi:lipoprotein NlpD
MINFFSYIYEKTLLWSKNHRAPYYLAGVSFAESSFFPVPPDVMLMSMGLASPKRSWRFALIATIFSVLGGVLGYCIGLYGMSYIKPYLMTSSHADQVTKVMSWFENQGFWMTIIAGFSPFPYKIFTITSGMMQMAFWPFLLGSIAGRGLRFFLVSGILFFVGEKIEPHLRRYVNRIAWTALMVLIMGFLLCSCSERMGLAPVEERLWRAGIRFHHQYEVKPGDTLYSIAFRYDLDYRQMAQYNHIHSPYKLRIGQVLQLSPLRGQAHKQTVAKVAPASRASVDRIQPSPQQSISLPATGSTRSGWFRPARGKVVTYFAPLRGNKGIHILGNRGDHIYAASSGVVAYSGSGLPGYGNLIIIKHDGQYLTAYGNNLRNLVHEGQAVKRGQEIADMGIIDRKYWGLHFEIRKLGKPVDPLGYVK